MRKNLISLILTAMLFNISCVGLITSCDGCRSAVKMTNDAQDIPMTSFAFVESNLYIIDATCKGAKTPCVPDNAATYGSGFFMARSRTIKSIGFVMTANHICSHRNLEVSDDKIKVGSKFIVYDYYGRRHDADFYFASTKADVCILIINDLQPDITITKLAARSPNVGSRVYNVAAPKAYYAPYAALIFEGIYSGQISQRMAFTIPTQRGSSGSPIFNQDGEVVAMTIGIPTVSTTDDEGNSQNISVIESLCLAEPLHLLRELQNDVNVMDDLLTLTMTSSKSHSR